MSPIGSCIWILDPLLVVLFEGTKEPLRSGSLLEEGCPWEWALVVYSLAPLPALTLFPASRWNTISYLLPFHAPLLWWNLSLWKCKPKESILLFTLKMSYWVIENVLDCVSFNFVFAFVMLGIDSRASCIWSVCCTIELYGLPSACYTTESYP